MNRRLGLTVIAILAAAAGAAVAARGSGAPAEPRFPARPSRAQLDENLRAVRLRDPAMYRQMVITLKATGYLPQSFAVPTRRQTRRPGAFHVAPLSMGRAPATVPAEVRAFVAFASRATHTPPETALARLRVLRRALGQRHGDVYAFPSTTGGPCFILTGQGGACAQSDLATRGFTWTVGGGSDGVPNSLVGVVADDVVEVQLLVDGRSIPVGIANSVAFAEYSRSGETASVLVKYRDGSQSSETVTLR
jgi:hypothetical protein